MEFAFFASVPSSARGFFSGPMTIGFLMGVGIMIFGAYRYTSSQGKLAEFQTALPMKAKFPPKVELGAAKCPNCGAILKNVPEPGEVVICEYCGTRIAHHYFPEPRSANL